MSSTDDRIVRMEFDNSKFKKGAQETKKALSDVDQALGKAGNNKGLLSMESNMQRVGTTATKMQILTTAALATVAAKATSSAINFGRNILGNMTQTIMGAGKERALALEQAKFQFKGLGLNVEKTMKSALDAVNGTAYGLQDAATVAAQFGGAGMKAGKEMTNALRGISGMAAQTGRSYAEIGQVMTGIAGVGKVTTQDLMQFGVRGLNVAAAMAKQMGKTEQEIRAMVSAGKIGFRDFAKMMDKAFGENATKANQTYTGALSNMKSALSRIGADIATPRLEAMRRIFNATTPILNGVHEALKPILAAMGERNIAMATRFAKVLKTIDGKELTNAFLPALTAVGNVLSPIKALVVAVATAFTRAFSGGDGANGVIKGIHTTTSALELMTRPFTWLATGITKVTPLLTILFRLVKMGGGAIGSMIPNLVKFIGSLVGLGEVKMPSAGGLIDWIKNLAKAIGSAITQVDNLMAKGMSLTGAFGKVKMPELGPMPKLPSLGEFKNPFAGMGKGDSKNVTALSAPLAALTEKLKGFNVESVKATSDGVFNPSAKLDTSQVLVAGENFESAGASLDKFKDGASDFGGFIKGLVSWIGKFFEGFNVDDLMASFNLAVLSTFMLKASKMMDSFGGIGDALSNSLNGTVGILGSLNETMGGFAAAQKKQATAKIIIAIAVALGVLAVSLWILSKIPVEGLVKALTALGAATWIFSKFTSGIVKMVEGLEGKGVNLKLIAVSVALMALGLAMVFLATAFRIMNKVDLSSVVKGLATIWVVMMAMEKLGNLGAHAAKNMIAGAVAIGLISGAMIGLALALLLFKLVDWGSMGKAGVALLGVSLAVGALAMIPYQGIAKVGVAMLAAAVGMNAIAVALIMFALVKWGDIAKAGVVLLGLTVSLGALALIGGPVTVSAFVALSAAMIGFAMALLMLNKVNWSSIGKLTVVLIVLLAAVTGLLAVLTLFAPIVPVLALFAAALLALGVALAAFSAALAIAMALAAGGTAAFAALGIGAAVAIGVFLQTLALQAPIMKDSILKILKAFIDGIVESVPMVINGVKRLWDGVKKELTGNDKKKQFADTGKSWMDNLKEKIQEKLPEVVDKAKELAIDFLKGLRSKAVAIGGEGAKFIGEFIGGVAANLGPVIESGVNLAISWINGVSSYATRISRAGADAVISFINSTAETLRSRGPQLGDAMGNLGVAMIEGLIGGIGSMLDRAMSAIGNLAEGMVGKAKSILKIFSPSRVFRDIGKFLVQGLTVGIQNNAAAAITAVGTMVKGQIAMATEYIDNFIQRLDQRALAARAKADGLAAAADNAMAKARKTKNKDDDKAAKQLQNRAKSADKRADKLEAKADKAKEKRDRAERFKEASLIEKAQMRSEDAQNQLAQAKRQEQNAEKLRIQADALDRQANAKGVTAAQRKRLRKEADDLRKQSRAQAAAANTSLNKARESAQSALAYQKKAGAEAAQLFQEAFDKQAKEAAEEAAFNKMTDSEKARERIRQAEELEKEAQKNLEEAKKLAYTDLEKANELANKAMEEAEKARNYRQEAEGYGGAGIQGLGGNGTVVDLTLSDAAGSALSDYENAMSAIAAASAGATAVEFNQHNYSPEALSPVEVYRQTKNFVDFAAEKLDLVSP